MLSGIRPFFTPAPLSSSPLTSGLRTSNSASLSSAKSQVSISQIFISQWTFKLGGARFTQQGQVHENVLFSAETSSWGPVTTIRIHSTRPTPNRGRNWGHYQSTLYALWSSQKLIKIFYFQKCVISSMMYSSRVLSRHLRVATFLLCRSCFETVIFPSSPDWPQIRDSPAQAPECWDYKCMPQSEHTHL